MIKLFAFLLSISGLLVGCSAGGVGTSSASPSPSASSAGLELPAPSPRFPAGACHPVVVQGPLMVLPDKHCTPGKADTRVTQDNLFATPNQKTPAVGLCSKGYTTKSVRPPVTYTDQLKRQQMVEYGYSDALNQHEEDHLIPLELGGDPADPANLWPEPGTVPNPKDSLETYLHNKVCYTRDFQLISAQYLLAYNWVQSYQQYSQASDWGQLHGRPLYH